MTLLWLPNSGHYSTKPRAQTITIVSWGAYYKRQELPVSLSRKQVFSDLAREVPRAGYKDYWVLRPDENGWL